jgi:putative CocE/NonD family hydrolase
MLRSRVALILLASTLLGADKVSKPGQYSGYSDLLYSEWVRSSQYVTMRDGVKLAVDIYRPSVSGKAVDRAYPVVWEATTARGTVSANGDMNLSVARLQNGERIVDLTKYGYVVAEVDRRGLGASYGVMAGYHNRPETEDAYEITEWLAKQPWSDGNIGMFGCSNTGEAVLHALTTVPPHLKAVFPGCFSWNKFDGFLRGGILANYGTGSEHPYTDDLRTVRVDEDPNGELLRMAAEQHQGNTSLYQLLKGLPFRDSWSPLVNSRYWQDAAASNYQSALERNGVPVYGFSGWNDDFRKEILVAYRNLHNPGRVLIGPWGHCQNDGFALVTERLRFFDRYLKGIPNGIDSEPPILYYTVGAPAGTEWRQSTQWPPAGHAPVNFYLSASQQLSAQKPKAGKAQDSKPVRYDAECPNRGNPLAQSCVPDGWGFTYTTAPLAADTELTGHPVVHLWISTTAADLNFFAYLEDVAPDGKVSVVTDGRLKASLRALATPPYSNFGLPYHRMFEEDRQLLLPGEAVELVFDMLPLSRVFAKGHKLRVTVTNADPREKDRQTIAPAPMVGLLRDRVHASYVTLPMIATR